METRVKERRIDEDGFLEMRKQVLAQWPTGKQVDLQEAVEYQRGLPESKNFMKVTERACQEGKTLIWPRAGTPILEDMIELVKALAELGIVLIPVTTDSYTRVGRYDKAQQGLEESIRTGKAALNGYPLVVHGVANTRKLVESCDGAFNARGVTPLSAGLCAEIAFASGMTGLGTSPFLTFGSYGKRTTLEECIAASQYMDRLAGYYTDRGVVITTDIHGLVPSGVFPLSVNVATMIVDALVAAEQGVRSIIPNVHCLGHLVQDIAWMRLTRRLLREYLDRFGYKDVVIPGIFANQTPLFPFPQSIGGAFAYLNYSAMVAALAEAEAAHVRTIEEGAGIATRESHIFSYESANWILHVVRRQKIKFEIEGLKTEEKVTEIEVRAILDRLLELGDGDIIVGAIRGVEAGVIDSPFSPNVNLKGNVLGIRDTTGACRYLEFGNLPIPDEIKHFHREKIAEREKLEKRKLDYQAMIEDLWALSKGRIVGTPRAPRP